jgi:hypothetical protein
MIPLPAIKRSSLSVRSDSLAERDGFEPPVPLVWGRTGALAAPGRYSTPRRFVPVRSDCAVERNEFELSVPLVWGESARLLGVSVSPSTLSSAAEADRRTTGF